MTMHTPLPRQGTILMFLVGLITILLIVAYAFVRNMQISAGSMQNQHKQELSRLAAEMGMQHAMAVCLHDYAMPNEVRDGVLVTGTDVATRIDGPHKNVFDLLSPTTVINAGFPPQGLQQAPQTYDMPSDIAFQDLFSPWYGGTYHFYNSRINGFSPGFTMERGYGRWFEANRWNYSAGTAYDPASYDDIDFNPARAPGFRKATLPVATGVSTPFPIVDPYQAGICNQRPVGDPLYNPLDNPLFLDADLRPVPTVGQARYRLRYGVTTYDMSSALWANTDMPWLDDASNWPAGAQAKATARQQYKDVVSCVGAQMVALELFQLTIVGNYMDSLESVFLGYGPQTNNQFYHATPPYSDGVPYDWATRNTNGFSVVANSQPMAYRSNLLLFGDQRRFHCVLGSPFMNGFDPTRPDGTKQWLGAPLGSFDDLSFALSGLTQGWEPWGENPQYTSMFGAHADEFAQRAATPFGKPYDIVGHPWAVNLLTASPRVIQAMVSAYIPPAMRQVLSLTETQLPRYSFTDAQGNTISGVATGTFTFSGKTWTASSWAIPPSAHVTIPGVGFDLFTDAFQPGGQTPFNYPTPANRDYWGSSPVDRRTTLPVPDDRTNAERYPGQQFFSYANEANANRLTTWFNTAANPPQIHDDGAQTAGVSAPAIGVDNLARHIVFYAPGLPAPAATVNTAQEYLTSYAAPGPVTSVVITNPGAGYTSAPTVVFSSGAATANAAISMDATAAVTAVTVTGGGSYAENAPPQVTFVGGTPTVPATGYAVISPNYSNWHPDFYPTVPFGNAGQQGASAGISIYLPSTVTVYNGNPATPVPGGEHYPGEAGNQDWTVPPETRPNVITKTGWVIQRTTSTSTTDALTTAVNSYWQRLSLAFLHAVVVTQVANLAWADPQDLRSKMLWNGPLNPAAAGSNTSAQLPLMGGYMGGPTYATDPGNIATLTRKSAANWNPKAADFATLEQVDRQFLANLGESFDHPGTETPSQALSERPPRYLRNQIRACGSYPGPSTYMLGDNINVAEYRVSNNIRTLLTPIDTTTGATLTTFSTDPQTGINAPPRNLWLLDEFNALNDPTYIPSVEASVSASIAAVAGMVGPHPTALARARAKLMERVLNDWRMSFLGSANGYKNTFVPKDFDGDGVVFCSGYQNPGTPPDPDTGLTCYAPVAANGNGPGIPTLTNFSVTGCLTFTRSHQFKIHVCGELVDNYLDKAVSEDYLEGCLLIDPDNNIVRSTGAPGNLPTGLDDSVMMMQHPIHNFYRGLLTRGYP